MLNSSQDLVLTIDVGNSTTQLGLVGLSPLRLAAMESFPTGAISQRFDEAWARLVSSRGAWAGGPAAMSCVAAEAGQLLERLLHNAGVTGITRVRGDLSLPIEIDYAVPARLGADRVAAACWCARRFPGKSCAIIDAGTAVTVDYLEQGHVYRGGAVIPGPALQLKALARHTAALPALDPDPDAPGLPGRDTAACMLGGVLHGLSGAVERIVAGYRQLEHGVDCVAATGGAWPALAPLVRLEVVHEPGAVLLGVAVAVSDAVKPGRPS